ncbi:STAS domain-containing protein [Actinospica sp. MGRD01-02]|uniref:STAS domain-containing protein n=1 Tax=Actinospica acidithermotolerans TaxID=2828514 RepID=A0A941E7V6_9ACTN|nr:STAS domain-containing protein [Actinospica acidithermotolerans]MBR7825563.1 STAS domain-containing protein [Actinospica acidithermotolerans]
MSPQQVSEVRAVAAAPAVRGKIGERAALLIERHRGGPARAVMSGEFDMTSAGLLAGALCEAVEAEPAGLSLDLSAVEFCDCSTAHALMAAKAFARTRGRAFTLAPCSFHVTRVLTLAGAGQLLAVPG